MDDVRMYNHALAADEIRQAMSGMGVTNIDPANGTIRVPVNQVLSWNPPSETERIS